MARTAWLAAISILLLMWTDAIRFWAYVVTTGEYASPDSISIPVAPLEIVAWCVRELLWSFVIAFLVSIVLGFVIDRLLPGSRDKLAWPCAAGTTAAG